MQRSEPKLSLSFGRSGSPLFPIVRRRLDLLGTYGSLEVTRDDQGQETWYALRLDRDLVQQARRIGNLLRMVRSWRSSEFVIDGEPVSRQEADLFLERLEDVRMCWQRHREGGAESCRNSGRLGCHALRIEPSVGSGLPRSGTPAWFSVGRFDGQRVHLDREAIQKQLDGERNRFVRLCPFFDANDAAARIQQLPATLEADGCEWNLVFDGSGNPAWVWPSEVPLPSRLTRYGRDGAAESRVPATAVKERRAIPPTRYADVVGQDRAVKAVRDLVELPLRHPELLGELGVAAQPAGVLLAGPPGTGKTLLARALAGECGAHIEIISGPSLLSMWLGQTEAALREVFDRARRLAPSVILFDEIDSLAPSRSTLGLGAQASAVAQLLVLLDGIEARGNISVLATTNRPEQVDPALRRPGRLDQVVWMGLPDEHGRRALFLHCLSDLKLARSIDRARLARELAVRPGLTGADIAFVCRCAALLCVEEATRGTTTTPELAIAAKHLRAALEKVGAGREGCSAAS